MRFIIIDPNLEAVSGHHFVYATAIVKEVHSRGWPATVIGHKRFPQADIFGAEVIPHFSLNGYPAPPTDPVRGYYDDFKERNDAFFMELAQLPDNLFPPGVLVLIPTACEYHLYGAARWVEQFAPISAPHVVAFVMLKSGVEKKGADDLLVTDPLRALFYKLAIDRISTIRNRFTLMGTGAIHADEYSALAGFKIEPHPLITNVDESRLQTIDKELAKPKQDRILLFAGDAKLDKGLEHVPGVARILRKRFPKSTLVVHANFATAWGPVTDLEPDILAMGQGDANIVVQTGHLGTEQYFQLLQSCRAAVFAYDPEEYRRKSSGVLWEALALGLPVAVPDGTWLEEEVVAWGGSVSTYSDWTVEGIAEAVTTMLREIEPRTDKARQASRHFRELNTARRMVDKLSDTWLRNAWMRGAIKADQSVTVDLLNTRLRGAHDSEMYNGKVVRWLSAETSMSVKLPPASTWAVRIGGPSAAGDAAERAALLIDGVKVDLALDRNGGNWTLTGAFVTERREKGQTIEMVINAPTQRFGTDVRELSLLCDEISFGAPGGKSASESLGVSRVNVTLSRGAVVEETISNAERLFTVAGPAGGDALVPVFADATLVLPIARGVEYALGMQVVVNGVPVMQMAGEASDPNSLIYHVPLSVLHRGGGRTKIELAPDPAAKGQVVVRSPYLQVRG